MFLFTVGMTECLRLFPALTELVIITVKELSISRLEPIGLPRQKILSEIRCFKSIFQFSALPVDNLVQISIHIKATMRNVKLWTRSIEWCQILRGKYGCSFGISDLNIQGSFWTGS